jgi:hypothetical protein
MSTDRRLPITEYHGQSPCIEPHLLGRILDRLRPLRGKVRDEASTKVDPWAGIDALAKSMEASN